MRSLTILIAACCLLALTAATASAKPPKLYKGTIEGTSTLRSTDPEQTNPEVVTDTWKISGLKLKRVKYGALRGGTRATYKITGGSVTWTQVKTGGRCQHNLSETFALKSAASKFSAPLAFDKYRGPWKMLGEITVDKDFSVNATCLDSDGSTHTEARETGAPKLFSVGGFSVTQKPNRRIKRTFKDSISNSDSKLTATWKLSVRG